MADTFEITPKQGADRNLVKGATVKIVHQGTLTEYTLTEYSGAKAGTYYRANVPYGVYDIYVNGSKIKDNHPFGIDRVYTFIETVDPNTANTVDGSKLKDDSVPLASLSPATIDYIDASGGGTITNFPDEVYLDEDASSKLTWHADKIKRFETGDATASSGLDKAGVYPHLQNLNVINVRDFGAVGDGSTDDTTAIQAAIDYCTSNYATVPISGNVGSKARVLAEGEFKITSTVTITCEVDFSKATFIVPDAFTSTAVKVQASDGSSYLQLNSTYLPQIKTTQSLTWAYNNVGLQITSVSDSKIHIGDVQYFQTGVIITTWSSKGTSYNDFFLHSIRENKTNLYIYPASSGWTNENNFYGGRLRISSGFSDYTDTVLLRLTGNNNAFYKLCIEGGNDETKIWLDGYNHGYGCSQNVFYSLRPESPSAWRLVADGSATLRNTIFRGYISNFSSEVTYVAQNGATAEALSVMTAREEIMIGTDQYGIKKYQNLTSDGYPIISFYSHNYDPKEDPDKATSSINSTGFEFKKYYTHTDPYLKADAGAGSYGGLRFNVNGKSVSSAPYLSGNWGGGTGAVELAVKNGALILPDNAYNANWLILGSYFLWVDTSGDLRIKNGKPTSDTDGTVVGTQS